LDPNQQTEQGPSWLHAVSIVFFGSIEALRGSPNGMFKERFGTADGHARLGLYNNRIISKIVCDNKIKDKVYNTIR